MPKPVHPYVGLVTSGLDWFLLHSRLLLVCLFLTPERLLWASLYILGKT